MYLHHLRFRRPQRDLDYVHKAVWAATGSRCLWGQPQPQHLVIMSPAEDLSPGPEFTDHTTFPYPLDFAPGQPIALSLIAHPTIARTTPGRTRGKREALPENQWVPWLERKTSTALTLDHVDATKLGPGVAIKPGRRATHVRVMFNGTAAVNDPAELRELINTGIGSGKAHGGGLLMVTAR